MTKPLPTKPTNHPPIEDWIAQIADRNNQRLAAALAAMGNLHLLHPDNRVERKNPRLELK